jgi:MerR family transcriptional regulator, copper efflux regulator
MHRDKYSLTVAHVPFSCSLTADDANTRVDEWRQFLRQRVVEIDRGDRCVRLRIEDGEDALVTAASLARSEKACCPFFEFRLVLLAEAIWLEIDAPEEAAAILDGLVDLQRG